MTANKKPGIKKQIFWTPLRVVLTAVVFSLIAIAGISSCTSSDEKETRSGGVASSSPASSVRTNPRPGSPPPSVAASSALPENVRGTKLHTISGETISLADYSGKVVLVNLWATWCGPCRMETPELVRIHKQFQSQGVEMVGLSIEDPEGTADSVKEFARNYQVDYHIGWAPRDLTIALYQVEPARDAIPQSFIISRDGRVFKKFIGFDPMRTPPALKQALEAALKGA